MFYDPSVTLSHNCMLNFVLSNRGGGKTTSTLAHVVKKFETTGEQFIWVRRSQTELDLIKKTMFAGAESAGLIAPAKYRVGRDLITCGDDDTVAGGIIALSRATHFKSVAWPNVKYIVFDEFLHEQRRYLKNEVQLLLSIIESVARMRDIRVLLLANRITKYNPYFEFFNIDYTGEREFQKLRKKSVLIHTWHSDEYTKAKKATTFAKMLEGTAYGAFMFENANILDSDDFVMKIKAKSKNPIMSCVFEKTDFTCWFVETKESHVLYFTKGLNKNAVRLVNFDDEMKENFHWVSRRSTFVRNIRKAAERGAIYFESGAVKLAVSALIAAVR